MIEWPLIFVTGVLGSAHCLGMCGPFAVALGATSTSMRQNFGRHVWYSLGRLCTYSVLGAIAGFSGWRLAAWQSTLVVVPGVLALLAGGLLAWQGVAILRRFRARGAGGPTVCLASSMFAAVLSLPGRLGAAIAGLFTGLLPCGLVYAYLSLAFSTGEMGRGLAVMALFGLGTFPVMIATGCGASLLTPVVRRRLYHAAAWSLLITGLLTIARGSLSLQQTLVATAASAPACPFCPSDDSGQR